jgi:hypothetical protein
MGSGRPGCHCPLRNPLDRASDQGKANRGLGKSGLSLMRRPYSSSQPLVPRAPFLIPTTEREHRVQIFPSFTGRLRRVAPGLGRARGRRDAASAELDPIHAAIKRWKEAHAVGVAGFEARNAAEKAFQDQYGSISPSAVPRELAEILERHGHEVPYWSLRTHEQITRLKRDAGNMSLFFIANSTSRCMTMRKRWR